MDELKKYIRQHADRLDLDEPGPRVWEQIREQSAPVKKGVTVMMFARWAAAACILVLAGIGIRDLSTSHPDAPAVAAVVPAHASPALKEATVPGERPPGPEAVADNGPAEIKRAPGKHKSVAAPDRLQPHAAETPAGMTELRNVENSFTQVINLQRDRIATMPMYAESPEYFKDFKIQIRQMERDEAAIKSDIAKRGMNDELLDQLINLYQQKLNTLKQLQIEMNKTNNRYKQNRGPVDSSKTYFLKL